MNFSDRTSRTPLALASTAVIAALLLSGCGQESEPTTGQQTASTQQASTEPEKESSGSTMDDNALIQLNDELSATLGDDYVQGWIKDGQLHVSSTNEDGLKVIEEAGATGHLVQFSNEQLRTGISEIMAWQGKQEPSLSSAIHAYTLNPETGGITLSVDPSKREQLQKLIETDKPLGQIPVDYRDSSGIMTPASQ